MTKVFQFENLLQPGRIGNMEIKNRLVLLPIAERYATEEGYPTDRIKDYYEERAKGGVGLVIVEATCIDTPVGKTVLNQLAIDDDKFIPGLRELAYVIKKHDAKVALQLHHAGNAAPIYVTKQQPVGPYAVQRKGYELPRALSVKEIRRIVSRFAEGAQRAKRAGFEGVEIHAAHNYLIAQFLSAVWNKRRDAYGGELENRARILLEILKAVRDVVGRDFPVWCRLNAKEDLVGGTTLEETRQVAHMAEEAGADAISVSTSGGLGAYFYLGVTPELPGALLPSAEAVKKVVAVPVIAAGRIAPELGEKVLREGKADFIGIGRGLIADPELPYKVATGRIDEIVPCVSCFNCYYGDTGVTCTVNPMVGRERERRITPAKKAKRVLIVGGGPAGMEAAIIASLRGHKVTLYEKNDRLGGQLIPAAIPPGKRNKIEPLGHYLETRVRKLEVDIELGKEVSPEIVAAINPDAVVVATGVIPLIPEIRGINRPEVIRAVDVLAGRVAVGERVAIIGGELVGCETANFLADKGKKVTILRRGPRMATKMLGVPRRVLLDRLVEKGVSMLTQVKYEEVSETGLVVTTREGERQLIEADAIVLAAGARSDSALFKALEGKVPEIYTAGDCVEPRGIKEAIEEGFCAGWAL